jgi:hypothetical protein
MLLICNDSLKIACQEVAFVEKLPLVLAAMKISSHMFYLSHVNMNNEEFQKQKTKIK